MQALCDFFKQIDNMAIKAVALRCLFDWNLFGAKFFLYFSFKVQNNQEDSKFSNIIDQRLDNTFTAEGMKEVIQLIVRCVQPSSERRPTMSYVVMELNRIREKEVSLTTVMGEGTSDVALGSILFKTTE